jgi:hypothetical protein
VVTAVLLCGPQDLVGALSLLGNGRGRLVLDRHVVEHVLREVPCEGPLAVEYCVLPVGRSLGLRDRLYRLEALLVVFLRQYREQDEIGSHAGSEFARFAEQFLVRVRVVDDDECAFHTPA